MTFSKTCFTAQWEIHAPSFITPKATQFFFMLFNYSLFDSKQLHSYTAFANCGFYYMHGVFSVRCELNVMYTCLSSKL